MAGKKVGYARVSTKDQSVERQLSDLDLDIVFTDYASGKDANRPKLQEMLNYIRDEDIVYVHSMDRLARNLDDLKSIIKTINNKRSQVHFMKEGLEFTGSQSPMSNLMLALMGAFAEFDLSLIKERQMEGIAKAKARGVYKRETSLNDEQVSLLKQRMEAQTSVIRVSKAALAKEFGVSRMTIYNYLKNLNIKS